MLLLTLGMAVLSIGRAEEEATFVSARLEHDKTLKCDEAEEGETVSWTFAADEQNDTVVEAAEDKFVVAEQGAELKIKAVEEENLGTYKCFNSEGEELKRFKLDISVNLKELPPSVSIDEGGSTDPTRDLRCTMHSKDLEVDFKWFTRPEGKEADEAEMAPFCTKTEDSDCSAPDAQALFDQKDRTVPVEPLAERAEVRIAKDEAGVPYSTITIRDTDVSDRRIFICRATLKGREYEADDLEDCSSDDVKHCDQTETVLRVKDPLAAVWPFCGIVAEVILLCIIIFFCERRKAGAEEVVYDEGSNGKNVASSRQR